MFYQSIPKQSSLHQLVWPYTVTGMNEYRWRTWIRFFFPLHNTQFLEIPSALQAFQQLYNNVNGPCRPKLQQRTSTSVLLFMLTVCPGVRANKRPHIQDLNNSRQSVTLPSLIAVMLEMTAKRPPSPSFITSTEPRSHWPDSSSSSHIYLAGLR